MRIPSCLALTLLTATLAPAQEVPGGKSLAELVRERFEANPPRREGKKETVPEAEELPPAPPVAAVSMGPTKPPDEAPPSDPPASTEADDPSAAETNPPAPVESAEGRETPPAEPEMREGESPEPEVEAIPEVEPAPEVEPVPGEDPAPAEAETPEQAPEAVSLPDLAPENATHVIKSGDTLTRVARDVYNSSLFSPLLEKHNDVDPRRLKIGQELSTPSLSDLVREQGSKLFEKCPEATALLVQIQHDYRALEDLSRSGAGTEEIHVAMDALEATATRIEETFGNATEALGGRPDQALSQLQQFHKNLAATKAGQAALLSKSGIRSRTYLATALMEAMKWGERNL